MEKKFNFVYITINLVNWKMYVGEHSTNNLNDNYLGSGTLFLKAINKYGRKNFIRVELEFFNTKEEIFDVQEKYIKEFKTLQPNGYNISPKGGQQCNGGCSEETKNKWKLNKNRIHIGEKNPMYNSNLYDKLLNKYGKDIADIKYKEWKIKNGIKQRLRKTSEKSKEKRYNTLKNKPKIKCNYCNKEIDCINFRRYHGENCKLNKNSVSCFKFKTKNCEYCNKEISLNNFKRYHGEKCKLNPYNLTLNNLNGKHFSL